MPPARPRPDGFSMIDLFSGCGGLSLGLELAGFSPIAYAEISPDAAQTYRANRDAAIIHFKSAAELLGKVSRDSRLQKIDAEARRGIDLICGGPPCQGFSLRGRRRTQHVETHATPSNHLYRDMVKVIARFKPRLFLFENVAGLLHARWTRSSPDRVFDDVFRAFTSSLGSEYLIDWDVLEAWRYGVPQLRRRLFIVGVRRDVASRALGYRGWRHRESAKGDARKRGLLPPGKTDQKIPSPEEILGDLVAPDYRPGGMTTRYPRRPDGTLQRWFRNGVPDDQLREHVYSAHRPTTVARFRALIRNRGVLPEAFRTKKFGLRLIPPDWPTGTPNLTITTLADDFVHYAQPRSLTVRECARFQTFPDWYEFSGKRSTGGHKRAGRPAIGLWDRETPKYTQIGNAVPVLLAFAIGDHLASLLRACRSRSAPTAEKPRDERGI